MCHRRAGCALSFLPSLSVALFALVLGGWLATPAHAQLQISFDNNTSIVDGGAGDLDSVANGKIDFSGVYGIAGYQVQGTLRESPPWAVGPSISQQLSAPVYSHLTYDVLPPEHDIVVRNPDILIVEGLNVLQPAAVRTAFLPSLRLSSG